MEIEVADVADMLDVIEKKRNHSATQVEQIKFRITDKCSQRQVARECFASEAADDHLLVGGGHGSRGLSHGPRPE